MHPYLSGLSNARFIPDLLSELRGSVLLPRIAFLISPENMNISRISSLKAKKNVTSEIQGGTFI
jgi:hypothetical protein